jgi:hypothetical protein
MSRERRVILATGSVHGCIWHVEPEGDGPAWHWEVVRFEAGGNRSLGTFTDWEDAKALYLRDVPQPVIPGETEARS